MKRKSSDIPSRYAYILILAIVILGLVIDNF